MTLSAERYGPSFSPSLREWPPWLLAALLLWHAVIWVLLPALSYQMLPLDAAELLGWGMEWQLGYYKHPPLGPWLGEAAFQLSGQQPESLYLLAQLGVLVTLYYVWRTARLVLAPTASIIATLVLELSYFHTVLTPNFNMNSLQLPIWAAMGFHFLRATRGASQHWLWLAAWSAAALLTKYSGALLLLTFVSILLIDPDARRQWRNPWLWGGAVLGLLLISPHLIWLLENWRLPAAYLQRFDEQGAGDWTSHLLEPLRFAIGALAGMLLSAVVALSLVQRHTDATPHSPLRWQLLALCLGPLILAMLYGAISGSRLKSTWAFPFFNLFGICLLQWLPLSLQPVRLRVFGILLALLMLGLTAGHLAYKLRGSQSKTVFDGPALALAVENTWNDRFQRPLRIVAGDHILTAIVSTYAGSRPSMLIEGRFDLSPWLSRADVEREGAAVLCEIGSSCWQDVLPIEGTPLNLEVDDRRFQLWMLAPRD
nr:glycosyltransferase family 39 protein [Pseudomarimonas arenosa]